jgi:hypothetical protein
VRGKVSALAAGANDSDDAGRGHAAGQKLLNREAPEMA